MIEAGKLNQRIEIEKPVKTTADSGAISVSWTAVFAKAVPAAYRPAAGGEVIRGVTLTAKTVAVFETRYLPTLLATPDEVTEYRIKWTSGHADPNKAPVLNIVRVHDPDGMRRMLLIEVIKAT